MYRNLLIGITLSLSIVMGCGGCGGEKAGRDGGAGTLSGMVSIDGSSTVFPITEAVAEEFQIVNRDVRVTVGISGTGGGFKKFCIGETDINDASRPIKEKEVEKAAENGVHYVELPVAFDGIAVVTNQKNTFLQSITVEELKRIWQPGSTVRKWSDVRLGWPDRPITLYGPGVDSGTFDYFTEAIVGKSQSCRSDFTASEDDNVLVQGIAGDPSALGFFGYAYYVENVNRLRLVGVDGGDGPVKPTAETINNGSYRPLSRPIFIYISTAAADRNEVREFVRFYIDNAPQLVKEVGYVPLPAKIYGLAIDRFESRVTGSAFSGRKTIGVSLEDLLQAER